jgi:hypothetical protein
MSDKTEIYFGESARRTMEAHQQMLQIHSRALACHCECMAMNAENCHRATLGQSVAYPDESYIECMKKWGMIDEKGEPLI